MAAVNFLNSSSNQSSFLSPSSLPDRQHSEVRAAGLSPVSSNSDLDLSYLYSSPRSHPHHQQQQQFYYNYNYGQLSDHSQHPSYTHHIPPASSLFSFDLHPHHHAQQQQQEAAASSWLLRGPSASSSAGGGGGCDGGAGTNVLSPRSSSSAHLSHLPRHHHQPTPSSSASSDKSSPVGCGGGDSGTSQQPVTFYPWMGIVGKSRDVIPLIMFEFILVLFAWEVPLNFTIFDSSEWKKLYWNANLTSNHADSFKLEHNFGVISSNSRFKFI